jgi:prevent-host-death family protein
MDDVPVRDLRNNVSSVLRRVQAGERLRVTVSGRPVAELVPLTSRPTSMAWAEFEAGLEGARSDAGLADDLALMVPDTTDDVGDAVLS